MMPCLLICKQVCLVSKPTTATISNAMDVGNPSNFVRILEIMNQDYSSFSSLVSGYTISDETTIQTIREVYQQNNYLLDPHGAVAYAALHQYQQIHTDTKGYIVETADPVKFPDAIITAIGSGAFNPACGNGIIYQRKKKHTLEK
jgi:threonine synthase